MKIDFEANTPHGLYRDALYLPDDHTMTNEEIDAMKQQRVDNWIAVITTPQVEETPAPDYIEVDGVRYAKVI